MKGPGMLPGPLLLFLMIPQRILHAPAHQIDGSAQDCALREAAEGGAGDCEQDRHIITSPLKYVSVHDQSMVQHQQYS